MGKILIAAVSFVALAGWANAATKHTWYQLNYTTATCELSSLTPEEFQSFVSGPIGHLQGETAEVIEPKDVFKDAYGNISVRVRADKDGNRYWDFFTSGDTCDLTAKTFKPVQAPSGDIN
ncbi:MAG: hypothetical protein WA397_10365 [Roseiarcus sp.]